MAKKKSPEDAAADMAATGADDEAISDAFDKAEAELLEAVVAKPRTDTQFDRTVRTEAGFGSSGGGSSSEMQVIIREWPEVKRMVEEIHEMMDKMGRLG